LDGDGDLCGSRVWRWDIDLTDPSAAGDAVTDITTGSHPDGFRIAANLTLGEVSGLALSPDHDQLFAFTPTSRGKYYSDYPSTWRITTCEASGETSCSVTKGWISLSEADDPTDSAFPVQGEQDREANIERGWWWALGIERCSALASLEALQRGSSSHATRQVERGRRARR
jgi:hypothetical protein